MQHHRTAGTDYRIIKIGEIEYKIRPLTVGVYSEMESYIVSQRGDPLEAAGKAVEKLPAQHHAAIWDAAMRQAVTGRTVTAPEAATFENSIKGLAWKIWQCLKQDHPEIDSVDAAVQLITKAGAARFEEIARAVEVGSGEADLGKSSGPDPTEAATKKDQAGQ